MTLLDLMCALTEKCVRPNAWLDTVMELQTKTHAWLALRPEHKARLKNRLCQAVSRFSAYDDEYEFDGRVQSTGWFSSAYKLYHHCRSIKVKTEDVAMMARRRDVKPRLGSWGLDSLSDALLNERVDKGLQVSNWGAATLSDSQLQYAYKDDAVNSLRARCPCCASGRGSNNQQYRKQ